MLSSHERVNRILLCGAGLSCALLGDEVAPGSNGFGAALKLCRADWRQELPFLSAAVDYLSTQVGVDRDNWTLDEVWDGIDENLKLRRIIRHDKFLWPNPPCDSLLYQQYHFRSWENLWVLAGVELKRALASVYGERLLKNTDLHKLKKSWLGQKLSMVQANDLIVSTNYDLLVEESVRVCLGLGKYGNCLRKAEFNERRNANVVPLAKLHGSLDWVFATSWLTGRSVVRRNDDGPMRSEDIDLKPDFWEWRPLLVAPVKHKDEVLFPHNQPGELLEVLGTQWMRFMDALEQAKEIIVAGYRFPSEDSYGMRMIQEAVSRRRKEQIRVELWLLPKDIPLATEQLKQGILGRILVVEPKGSIPPL